MNNTYKTFSISLLFILAIFVFTGCKKKQPEPPVQNNVRVEQPTIVSSGELDLAATYSGDVVTIESVDLERSGFVVVRDDLFGEPNIIVGSSKILPEGLSMDVDVELSVNTPEDLTLYAFLHVDDGDEIFRQLSDPQVVDEAGSPVQIPFTVTDLGDLPQDLDLQF